MAVIHPFEPLRPVPERVEEVACVPYDVINTREAARLAQGRSYSFLHVIRPEIDLPPGTDEHDDAVYAKGAKNLRLFAESNVFVEEGEPSLYIYQLIMDGRAQTGIFGCVSVAEYDDDTILKHEKTRPDKEDDRTRHILAQRAHAEPVMLTYRGTDAITRLVSAASQTDPLYDFISVDGVRHTIWTAGNAQDLVDAFGEDVSRMYVADGHHRCKAASRAAEALRENGRNPADEFEYFPAVIFPMDQLTILPYNRIVVRLPHGAEAFIETMRAHFDLREDASSTPSSPGNIALYLAGRWYRMALPETKRSTVADALDVSRLNEFILEPLLDIKDPRTDPNLYFVGGIRGTQELERLVDSGEAELAISMYATSIEELVDVSDAGLLMPPKSTWFEPKLRSGLLIHRF